MRFKLLIIFLMFAFALGFEANAQDETSLSDQYQNMIESSETFEKYKVIPITKVNAFGEVLNDSINSLKETVSTAQEAKLQAISERDSAKSKMNDLQAELTEAQNAVDQMPFFGLSMTKVTYNIVMWTLVGILLAGGIIIYVMFLNSFRVTKQARKDKELVDNQLEELRQRAHDKQVKIKRELQTALNKLEESKR